LYAIFVTLVDEYIQMLCQGRNYMKSCHEIACVGAGIGGGFENTTELHTMKYDEAMNSEEAEQWKKSVEQEYQRMEEN
jgi:hypothetical protein